MWLQTVELKGCRFSRTKTDYMRRDFGTLDMGREMLVWRVRYCPRRISLDVWNLYMLPRDGDINETMRMRDGYINEDVSRRIK